VFLSVCSVCGCAAEAGAPQRLEQVRHQQSALTDRCAEDDDGDDEGDEHSEHAAVIPIGALVDQTGPSTSPLFKAAVQLAVSQMNEAVHPHVRFDLSLGNTAGTVPATAKSEALRLINQQGVLALVSDSSGDTVQVNGLNYDPATLAKVKVPVTCFQCSSGFIHSPTVVDPNPVVQAAERDVDHWLFRVFYNSNFEAAVQDELIVEKPNHGDANGDGALKVSIYADGGHKALATAIGPLLPSFFSGPSTVEIINYTNPANFGSEWARVLDNFNESTGQTDGPPDVVVLAMLPANVTAAFEFYRNAGFTTAIQSNNSFRRNYILAQIGAIADGFEGSSVPLVDTSESGQDFVTAFTQATGQGPELTSSGAYDSTVTLMLASLVGRASSSDPGVLTPADVRQGLTQINDPNGAIIRPKVRDFRRAARLIRKGCPINYEGAFNPDDWNSAGDIFPPLVHWKVQNQQFSELEYFQCDPQHPLCPVKP
jgi:ABC-type branched-subunit amino acid transport system substrate-binding protein